MLHTAIEAITESDLHSLVREGKSEDTQLEFKLKLPGNSDEEKREFLKDVSAMANSEGGDIIYGIKEERSSPEDAGRAAELVGLIGVGADATKLWMFELLNSSIDERLIGVVIRDIQLSSGGFALVVRVPRSWHGPHVVRHRNHWRFYARNSAGVYAMNVTELRTAFLLSDTLVQRLETVREERLHEVFQRYDIPFEKDWSNIGSSSTDSDRRSLLVLQLQPFDSVRPGYGIDIVEALHRESENLRLSGDVEGTARINFDGVLVTNREDFFQLYRSGSTLEVDSGELTTDFEGSRNTNESIGATELDRAIFKGVGRRLALLKSLGVTSPVLVSISLLGVKGCNLSVRALFYVGDSPGGYRHSLSRHRIDRPNLFLSGLVIENLQELPLEGFRGPVHDNVPRYWEVVQSLLRPYCDSIWNAFGYPRSTYFDPEGKWLGQVSREARA